VPTAHNLGFPRIGAQRELKWALESYWQGRSDRASLLESARQLRVHHWRLQQAAGLDQIPVGDFSLYDQVLDHSVMFGAIPARFDAGPDEVDLDTYFRMARGRAPSGTPAHACEMTKWFDSNYHYIVPELQRGQSFRLASHKLFDEVAEAKALGLTPRPVLIGPLTWLWLGKVKEGPADPPFDRLELLTGLLPIYSEILRRLREQGVEWVQIDEPILVLDLPYPWQRAFESVYSRLSGQRPKLLLTTYFGALGENLRRACQLPVDGLHVDLVRAPEQLPQLVDWLPQHKVLSVGVIDGRNIWRADITALLTHLEPLHQRLGQRLWIGPSCSLLHVPVDLSAELLQLGGEAPQPDGAPDLVQWLAFATQKLAEIQLLSTALSAGRDTVAAELAASEQAMQLRRSAPQDRPSAVRQRLANLDASHGQRNLPYPQRAQLQQQRLRLPPYPTTTIGSFPQTEAIRGARHDLKTGRIDHARYQEFMRQAIAEVVSKQEAYGLDVLVHGEPERNDMVEYFGEQLTGFAFSRNGWVQSYGSRCVKPPIIYADIARPRPMTVDWIRYAQALTDKPLKGMLTGPVTLLNWSFVRDDQPREETCQQLALAIRDEVQDLERAGIAIIQIDEAALREGLPLRRAQWEHYLNWAVAAFRLAANGVADTTQIHTHMCYSDFNDILPAIAAMDADVITIETARSDRALLTAFRRFHYPNGVGPGVYDIHSPNVPSVAAISHLLQQATEQIPSERIWVNPDCGLKTRGWPEVEAALRNMVTAAQQLRQQGAHRSANV